MLFLLLDLLTAQNVLLCAVITLFAVFCGMRIMPRRSGPLNLPPGPIGYPLVGNLLSFTSPDELNERVRELKHEHNSNIVYMNMAGQGLIILYDMDAIQQAFQVQGDEFDSRPLSMFYMKLINYKGLIGSSGSLWKEQRRFALRTLRDFGMGKSALGEKIAEETYHFISELEKHGRKPFQISLSIDVAISNVICALTFGRRFHYEDEKFRYLNKLVRDNLTYLGRSTILNYAPFLQHVPFDIFGFKQITQNIEEICEFFKLKVDEHKRNFDENNVEDFIDAFLAEQKRGDGEGFTDQQLYYVIMDLFVAGSETSASTLRWAALLMTLHNDVQRKVQAELDDVVPRSRKPSMSDRPKLPYTMAVLHEIQRFASVVPFGLPHSNPYPTRLLGYDIPADTVLVASLTDVLQDPNVWKHPNDFNPENFLDDQGHVINQSRSIPFALGKRVCLGESLAREELFTFFTAMLQNFEFCVDETKPTPTQKAHRGVVDTPDNHFVVLKKRD
ncbi:cytochrome P450 2J6-like [Tubulanus polymorphus]|uniref:cytochrome P450 2J6-like n=1 Tax=Tubulanus polymorphus TaxID=672921 RepID=UPI003DA56ED1